MLDRRIAVKILPAQFTEDYAQVQRFEREARAASALNHPNIITIHEIGLDGDTHFIATEFVAGQTLREKIADRTLSLNEAVSIAIQIADALTAAHAAGIVHRDIKPENVMARPDGLVKVLDFGLAKPAARESSFDTQSTIAITMKTDPGMLMGTLAYLSPEQVLRQDIDHRTDIFSLGIVLYELIVGTRPFAGSSAAAVCEAILLQSVTVSHPDIPLDLRRIINRALEKDRAGRYQTTAEMRNDLQQFIGEVSSARRGMLSGWRSKAAAGVSALLILATILAWSLRREPRSDAPPFSTGPVKRVTDMAIVSLTGESTKAGSATSGRCQPQAAIRSP